MFRATVLRRLPKARGAAQFRKNSSQPPKSSSGTKLLGALVLTAGTGYIAYNSYVKPQEIDLDSVTTPGSLLWKGHAVKPFTLDDVKSWMEKGRTPCPSGWQHPDVKSWEAINLASNSPCEDTLVFSEQSVANTPTPWLFWGVFDGHVGSAMSHTLKEVLPSYVSRNISQLYQSFTSPPPPSTVDIAIQSAFRQLDDDIKDDALAALAAHLPFTETFSRLAPALAGSCAILAVFDPATKLLRVACTGDSRAVLGRRAPDGSTYVCTPLSVDQTGHNPLETARLAAAHPGETGIVDPATGRVLGIMVSRAFGDAVWKWPAEALKELKARYFWKSLRPGYLSPPYLTAEPVVTCTRIEGGEFVVLASDGLWDHLSSEQVVKLVGMWLDAKAKGTIGREGTKKAVAGRVERKNLWDDVEAKVKEERFVVVDESVTAHLVRNALGGSDEERVCGLAGAKPPFAREVRDDITVQVLFF